jgi:hypothetical protein
MFGRTTTQSPISYPEPAIFVWKEIEWTISYSEGANKYILKDALRT